MVENIPIAGAVLAPRNISSQCERTLNSILQSAVGDVSSWGSLPKTRKWIENYANKVVRLEFFFIVSFLVFIVLPRLSISEMWFNGKQNDIADSRIEGDYHLDSLKPPSLESDGLWIQDRRRASHRRHHPRTWLIEMQIGWQDIQSKCAAGLEESQWQKVKLWNQIFNKFFSINLEVICWRCFRKD